MLGCFVVFAGLFTLANVVLSGKSSLARPGGIVTPEQLAQLLETHPQNSFKKCLGRVLSENDGLVNKDVYRCEKQVYRNMALEHSSVSK